LHGAKSLVAANDDDNAHPREAAAKGARIKATRIRAAM
jgi:hypothetical protein